MYPICTPVASLDDVARRAGGRRHYNAIRPLRATMRRQQVISLLRAHGWSYGSQRRVAATLGVSSATVCRDIEALRAGWYRPGDAIDLRTPEGAARLIGWMRMVTEGNEC
jgi:hypothetical protein